MSYKIVYLSVSSAIHFRSHFYTIKTLYNETQFIAYYYCWVIRLMSTTPDAFIFMSYADELVYEYQTHNSCHIYYRNK